MWTDAQLENWWLRQRYELSRPSYGAVTTPPSPSLYERVQSGNGVAAPLNPSPYERVQSGNGVVRLRLKPAKVDLAPLFDDGVDDLWRD